MVMVTTIKTGKGYGSKDGFNCFDDSREFFQDIAEARIMLKERYGTCKRSKMHIDTKAGDTRHIGYIYHFHNADLSHAPVEKWYQQDWVEFHTVSRCKVA